jgi:hypothetical protein
MAERRASRVRLSPGPLVAIAVAATGMAAVLLFQAGRSSDDGLSPVERDQAEVSKLVETYLAARAGGDGEQACDQLSDGQQREVVARVGGLRMVDAAPERCAELVGNVSSESRFTSPELGAYEGHEIEVRVASSGAAAARPAGLPGPTIYAWKREAGWQLDGAAMFGANFLAGCRAKGQSDSYCGCVFDEARARNPANPATTDNAITQIWTRMLSGAETPLLQSILNACGANEAQAAQGAGRASS